MLIAAWDRPPLGRNRSPAVDATSPGRSDNPTARVGPHLHRLGLPHRPQAPPSPGGPPPPPRPRGGRLAPLRGRCNRPDRCGRSDPCHCGIHTLGKQPSPVHQQHRCHHGQASHDQPEPHPPTRTPYHHRNRSVSPPLDLDEGGAIMMRSWMSRSSRFRIIGPRRPGVCT